MKTTVNNTVKIVAVIGVIAALTIAFAGVAIASGAMQNPLGTHAGTGPSMMGNGQMGNHMGGNGMMDPDQMGCHANRTAITQGQYCQNGSNVALA